ncbi:MAG: hypothetical protein KDA98_06735 [Acidimicrobiales bacterium]|nr:hypothetical protein [Acidimicrobiales bacterium]
MGGGERTLRRRRWVFALAAASTLVGATAACGSSGSSGGGGAGGPSRPEPVGEPVDLAEAGLHELSPPPLAGDRIWGAVQVATDHEVVLWGGLTDDGPYGASSPRTMRTDGAVLSLDDGRWTEMPPAPFDEGLYDAAGFWDGTEVIVLGTECEGEVPPATDGSPPACPAGPAAAAFDPASWSWRRLDPPPIPSSEYYETAVLGRSVAVGGDGVGSVTFGFDADSITWDRATESWGTVPPPFPGEGDWSYTCADPIARQIVALPGVQPGGDATELRVSAAGGDGWSSPLAVDVGIDISPTCGDGHLTSSALVGGPVDGTDLRSEGVLVDTSTGAVSPAFDPVPDLRSSWIVGPWLFARSSVAIGDIEGKDVPKPTSVRLVRGGETVEVPDDAALPSFDGLYLPGVGLFTSVDGETGTPRLVIWRPPPELQP